MMKDSQEGQPDSAHILYKGCFVSHIWDRQLEHNTYTQDVNKRYGIQEAADAVPVKKNAPLLHYVV